MAYVAGYAMLPFVLATVAVILITSPIWITAILAYGRVWSFFHPGWSQKRARDRHMAKEAKAAIADRFAPSGRPPLI